MARTRRRGSGRDGSHVITLISVSAVVVGLLLFFGYAYLGRAPEVDFDTGCPKVGGLSKRSISFLLDTTQKLSPTQEELIKDIFFRIVSASESYDRIQIYEVDPSDELFVFDPRRYKRGKER